MTGRESGETLLANRRIRIIPLLFFALAFVSLLLISSTSASPRPARSTRAPPRLPRSEWSTRFRVGQKPLTVHLVPHSHDDVGYEKNLNQYYYGSNNTIRAAGVQYTLDSIMPTLEASPDRRFVQVEQAFFTMWWLEQSPEMQDLVRSLVKSGQLEFANGGWCMHDLATTSFVDMLDQMTLGHAFIAETFDGYVPRTGWSIDPFGHSSTGASLVASLLGFDSYYMGRIDWEDKLVRELKKEMEFCWDPSAANLGSTSEIFGATFWGHYGAPPGYCLDEGCDGHADDPIMDDHRLEDYNVEARVGNFLEIVAGQSFVYDGDDILITMGGDFLYMNSARNFKEMDKLIKYGNEMANGKMILRYSTPMEYTRAKLSTPGIEYSVKTDDFFPYADNPHGYWVGFFTSRPTLKRYVRAASAFLQTGRQLAWLSGVSQQWKRKQEQEDEIAEQKATSHSTPTSRLPHRTKKSNRRLRLSTDEGPTRQLAEGVAVAQHHDAVTGTEMQHVAYDYALRISKGWDATAEAMAQSLTNLLSKQQQQQQQNARQSSAENSARASKADLNDMPQLVQCPLSYNESICDISQSIGTIASTDSTLLILVYNPLSHSRSNELVSVAVDDPDVEVLDADGRTLNITVTSNDFLDMHTVQDSDDMAEKIGAVSPISRLGVAGRNLAHVRSALRRYRARLRSWRKAQSQTNEGIDKFAPSSPTAPRPPRIELDPLPARFTVHFHADLKPLGLETFFLRAKSSSSNTQLNGHTHKSPSSKSTQHDSSSRASLLASIRASGELNSGSGSRTGSEQRLRAQLKLARMDVQIEEGAVRRTRKEARREMEERQQKRVEAQKDQSSSLSAGANNDDNDDFVYLENDILRLAFSSRTGLLVFLDDKRTTPWTSVAFNQQLLMYSSYFDPDAPGDLNQNAGAYISRFQWDFPRPLDQRTPSDQPIRNATATLKRGAEGPVVWEMIQTFAAGNDSDTSNSGDGSNVWGVQIVRLEAGSSKISFRSWLGPVPLMDGDGVQRGKEIISSFDLGPSESLPQPGARTMDNGGVWYTDSNGRELIRRQRDHRDTWNLTQFEPIVQNYYPVNHLVLMNDAASRSGMDKGNKRRNRLGPNDGASLQLVVLPDRSVGCSSLSNSALEVMLHRRLVGDDNKGVHEPLNETMGGITPYPNPRRIGPGIVVQSTLNVLVQTEEVQQELEHAGATGTERMSWAGEYRAAQSSIYMPVQVMYGMLETDISTYLRNHLSSFSLGVELPPNLELITMQPWSDDSVFLRLAHSFGLDEDEKLGQPVEFDLATLFPGRQFINATELSLSGNQPAAEVIERRKLNPLPRKPDQPPRQSPYVGPPLTPDAGNKVIISAMQVRAFQMWFAPTPTLTSTSTIASSGGDMTRTSTHAPIPVSVSVSESIYDDRETRNDQSAQKVPDATGSIFKDEAVALV